MEDERADIVFTDPPYNVPIDGHVTGLGQIRHREFAMGAGEMSVAAFTGFLQQTLGDAAAPTRNGAIAFVAPNSNVGAGGCAGRNEIIYDSTCRPDRFSPSPALPHLPERLALGLSWLSSRCPRPRRPG